jgi:hypothetical protein
VRCPGFKIVYTILARTAARTREGLFTTHYSGGAPLTPSPSGAAADVLRASLMTAFGRRTAATRRTFPVDFFERGAATHTSIFGRHMLRIERSR